MTRFADKSFTVGGTSAKYRENYDAVFAKPKRRVKLSKKASAAIMTTFTKCPHPFSRRNQALRANGQAPD